MAIVATGPLLAQPLEVTSAPAEVLTYNWRLQGMVALLARFILPVKGDSTLSTISRGDGRLESELKITSKRTGGDYWLYGSFIETGTKRPSRAWNSYRFRKREEQKNAELDDPEIIDLTSGIYLLRTAPPAEPWPLKIWSDGRVYPVLLSPGRLEQREIGGRAVSVTHHAVTAREVPGERVWSGQLDIWFALDEAATPVEIDFQSKRGRVRMLLEGFDG